MSQPATSKPSLPFSFASFGEWYDDYSTRVLEPARLAAVEGLKALLDERLPEPERIRLDVRPGRIKSKSRAWQKLGTKYANEVTSVEAVPDVMDDLVGLRIVCTNASDQMRLVQDLLPQLDTWQPGTDPILAIHGIDSIRDYLGAGKESGYRAYHVNLCTSVTLGLERKLVVCELQVRTLLQESWGELTHEDTYKPGSPTPPLARTLSKRMADLMATLDDMADDLRAAIELEATTAVREESPAAEHGLPAANPDEQEAVRSFIASRLAGLARPIDVASLAWETQREFGQNVSQGWVGYGTFKALVQAAVPDAQLVPDPPGWVWPSGYVPPASDRSEAIPRLAELLHELDRAFPLVETTRWNAAYDALARATHEVQWDVTRLASVHELSRVGRELAKPAPVAVTRRHLAYIAKALRAREQLSHGMDRAHVASAFGEWAETRIASFDPDPVEVQRFRDWLGGDAV